MGCGTEPPLCMALVQVGKLRHSRAPGQQGRAAWWKRWNRRRLLGDDLSPPLGLSLGCIQARMGLPARPSAAVSSAPSHRCRHIPRPAPHIHLQCQCQAVRCPCPPLQPPPPPPGYGYVRGPPASPSTPGPICHAVSVAPGFLPPAALAQPCSTHCHLCACRPLVSAGGTGEGARDR